MEKINLPTLGRSVALGDLYDYSRDKIISNGFSCSIKCKETNMSHNGLVKSCVKILIDPSEEEKWALLKLQSHLQASIMAQLIPPEDLWCSEYLFQEPSSENLHVACVTVYLTACIRHEICDPTDFIGSVKIKEIQSLDRPTHVVSEIVHGFNALFNFQLPTSSTEEKIYAENQLFLWAKKMFSNLSDEIYLADQDSPDFSILTKSSWYLCTDLKWGCFSQDDDFSTCLSALQKLLRCCDKACYVPVKMSLCSLESLKVYGPPNRDLEPDLVSKLFSLKSILLQVHSRCQFLLKDSFLPTIPHLSFRLKEFQKCIQALNHYISSNISSTLIGYRRCGISKENVKKVCRENIYNFFLDDVLMEWLITRQQELFLLKSLLENVDIPWKAEELVIGDIKPGQHAKSLVFKTKLVDDPVISKLKKSLYMDESEDLWTTFEILEANQKDMETFRTKLNSFCENAPKSYCYTILVTSTNLEDGAIQHFNRPFLSSSNQDQDDFIPLTSPAKSRGLLGVPPLSFHVSPKQIEAIAKNRSLSLSTYEHNDCVDASKIKNVFTLDAETIERNEIGTFDYTDPKKSALNLAQEFVRDCRCLKEGVPAIYLLKANERTSPNQEFRWFDIGKPSKEKERGHKVVVLLGAAGCGKSAVVNGMINYILGVEWSDPFRFCVVNEAIQDENLSQTTSVTAYTIHYMEGMKIPFDFTVIDTPGYGDIRGLERDREVTRNIGQFLSHPETLEKFDFVNAVCFVASSADCRLTPTQQYILESVSNIFGSDVRKNLKLLVTFSNGVKPPVLQAIREACISGFRDEQDVPIPYHKFNNSALYATNVPNLDDVEDAMYFDQLFWDLGRSNFQSFFENLSVMPDHHLDEVEQGVNSKIRFEKLLHDIELQLDIAFCKIENIEKFKQMVTHFSSEFESYSDYEIEVEEPFVIKIACRGSKWAYNCRNCSFSCEKSFSSKDRNRIEEHSSFPRPCCNKLCLCPGKMHGFDQYEFQWAKVKVKKTLQDMKETYEIKQGRKLSIKELLVQCQHELYEAKLKGVSLLEESLGASGLNSKTTIVSDYVKTLKSLARSSSRIQTFDNLLHLIVSQKDVPELARADSLTNNGHSSVGSEQHDEVSSRDSSFLDVKKWGFHLLPKMFSKSKF